MKTKKYTMRDYIDEFHIGDLESFAVEFNLSNDNVSKMYGDIAKYMIVIHGPVKYLNKIEHVAPNREESA